MIKPEKIAWWGWSVNLVLAIALAVSLGYALWQTTLIPVENALVERESGQLKTKIAFLQAQLRQKGRDPVVSPPHGLTGPLPLNRQQIYEFFTEAARYSGLTIRKAVLRQIDAKQGALELEMEFDGSYPETETFFKQIYEANFRFDLDQAALVQSPDPARSLKLSLTLNIPAPGRGR